MSEPILMGAIAIAIMLFLSAFGAPIGFALGIVGAMGLWVTGGLNFMLVTLETMPFEFANNYTFVVLPMFILMGGIAASSGIVSEIYMAAYRWTAGVRGGLLMATVLASSAFSAISGSSTVNSVVFTRIALPEMIRFGYNKAIGAGAIAAAGLIDAFIPPSLSMVIYGFLTGESIGQLLIAGVIPGLVMAGVFMLGIAVIVWRRPEVAPMIPERFSFADRFASLKDLWPTMVLIILVLGGLYTGLMPPSAAGSVGAVGTAFLVLMKRRFNFNLMKEAFAETLVMTSVLTVIVVGGILFARFLTLGGFLGAALDLSKAIGLSKTIFLVSVAVLFLFLGMFVDTLSIWVITVPVLHPIALSMGMDPLWFAIFILQLSGIGCLSPPVGLSLFAVMAASEGRLRTGELYAGVMPFIVMSFVVMGLFILFPGLVTWLPSMMLQ